MFSIVPFDKRNGQLQKNEPGIFDIDRVFENFFNDTVFPAFYSQSGSMKVDIKENAEEYILDAELPGMRKEDIELSFDEDRLTIKAGSVEEKEEKKENYLRRERRSTSMTRSFYIQNVDIENVTANMENGILSVKLPKIKKTTPQSKIIDVK